MDRAARSDIAVACVKRYVWENRVRVMTGMVGGEANSRPIYKGLYVYKYCLAMVSLEEKL